MKLSVLLLRVVLIGTVLFTASACSDDPSRVVVMLFDTTGSSASETARFGQEARVVLATLRPGTDRQAGDLVAGDAIHALPFGGARLELNAAFPRLDRASSNRSAHLRRAEALRYSLAEQVDAILTRPSSGCSDLLSAFEVPARVFKGHPEAEKVLVVFSDVVHTCGGLDFGSAAFTADRARALVDELREQGRLPDLGGVEVWISGLGSTGQMPAEQALVLESFWRSFLEGSGATYREERVGPTLLNWPSS